MDKKRWLQEALNANKDERDKSNEAAVEEWLKEEGDEEIKAMAERDPLVNFERKREEIKGNLLKFFEATDGTETIATAYDLLNKHCSEVMTPKEQEEMHKALTRVRENLLKQDSLQISEGMTIQEFLKTPQQYLDAYQKVGNLLYERNDFEGASAIYTLLVMFNTKEPNYWMGLGHTIFQMQKYEFASQCYYQCAIHANGDPLPYLYLVNCSLKYGDTEYAATLLNFVEDLLRETPDENALKLLNNLRRQL